MTPFGVVGGAERWLLAVLGATQRLDVDVVMLGDGPLRARLTDLGIRTRVVQTGARGRDLVAATVDVAGLLWADRPEVVLANGVKAATVALPASWAAGIAAVWVKHDLSFDRLLAWPLGRLADGVIAVSERAGAAVRRRDVTVLPPPRPGTIPAGRTEARQFWSDRGIALRGPTVAMATRLLPHKGVDDMLRALARPGVGSWHFVVIGPDDYAAPGETRRLTMLARRLGVADRVSFAGAVADAGRWLAAFDAVAVLTRRDGVRLGGEGYSLTALEAAFAGVPLIATTEVPAARELAASAVVAPRDHDAIAGALAAIAASTSTASTGSASFQIDDHPDAASVADTVVARLAAVGGRPGAGLSAQAPMSVVTTVLNERDEITRLCDALTPQLGPDDELLLVDGGSTDGTLDVFRAWAGTDPRLRLIEARGSNIAAGRNVGIAQARHAVVAFTDAGCVPADGWLDALRAGFAEPDVPAIVTGVYRVSARTAMEHAVAASCYPQPGELRRRGPLVRVYGRLLGSTFDATTPTGRSMAGARTALMAAGGFDEALATAEDVTVGRDIAREGGRCILAADAEVVWSQRPTMWAQTRMWYAYGRGDGQSRDRLLIARNAYRAAAYAIGAGLVGRRRWRAAVAVAAAAYVSLPLVRVLRDGRPLRSVPLVPVALATKDLAKVVGCMGGMWQQATTERRSASTPPARDRRAPRPRRRVGGEPSRSGGADVAVLLPEIGLDGRSRVVASVVAILNERGITPDLLTFTDVHPPTSLDRFIDTPLRYTIRRVDRPFTARGAVLSDLALSRSARRLPPYAGYVMLNTPDIGFGPDAFVLRYITFPTERIREFEERYTHQPYWSFGALLSAVFRRARRHRTPQGRWLANSAFVRSLVIETYGLAPTDVHVLYGPATFPDEPVRHDRDRLVVSVGGFHSDKRQLEQIEIAAMLPDVSFAIIGSARSPRYLRRCERRAAALPNVTLLTDVTRSEMDAVVNRAKVFLHTKHYEHQGLSTVEGVSRGCVPVVHDSGGQQEVVPDARLRFTTAAEAAGIIDAALSGAFDECLPTLRRHAEAFGEAAFHESLSPHVDQLVEHARGAGSQGAQSAADAADAADAGGGEDALWPVGRRNRD